MLNTTELEKICKEILPSTFDGVFPINELPITYKSTYNIIFNTDPNNLSGKHWIAVSVRKNKHGYVFDSFGYPPPVKVQTWLNARGIKWDFNHRQVQADDSFLCGHYCIYFLYFTMNPYYRNQHFETVMTDIFPKHMYFYNYDALVRDFTRNVFPKPFNVL